MNFITEKNRIYLKNDEGEIIAEILFPETDEKVFTVTHTFVDESLRGRGVAGKLMELATECIKNQGGTVKATCSYALKWLEKNGNE